MSKAVTLESIPHRAPFLFVDEIVEVSQRRIVTRKYADPDADFFRGHYPDEPVMPGVLLCECCFQAGALLIAGLIGPGAASDGIPVVTRIRDARFRRVVRPGDTLDVETVLDDIVDDAYFLTGRITVVGRKVLRVTFVCMQARRAEGSP
jgi:3-hydroxyacyl-[acyl-carrier-protein] dehydratase